MQYSERSTDDGCRTLLAKGSHSHNRREFSKAEFYWRLTQGVSVSNGCQDYGALFVASFRLSFLYYRQQRIAESQISASQALSVYNLVFQSDALSAPVDSQLNLILDKLHEIVYENFEKSIHSGVKSFSEQDLSSNQVSNPSKFEKLKCIYTLSQLRDIRNNMFKNGNLSSPKQSTSTETLLSSKVSTLNNQHQLVKGTKIVYTSSQLRHIRNDMKKKMGSEHIVP